MGEDSLILILDLVKRIYLTINLDFNVCNINCSVGQQGKEDDKGEVQSWGRPFPKANSHHEKEVQDEKSLKYKYLPIFPNIYKEKQLLLGLPDILQIVAGCGP